MLASHSLQHVTSPTWDIVGTNRRHRPTKNNNMDRFPEYAHPIWIQLTLSTANQSTAGT